MHVCLIDDDPRFLTTLRRGFHESGYECEVYSSPDTGLERLLDRRQPQPDVLLLDVMMPDMSGWDLLAKIRAAGVDTPVIYVTARQDVDERVLGLELGADDYVIKPVAFKELLARVHAVLRRHWQSQPIRLGDLVVHRDRMRIEFGDLQVEVSPREHEFVLALCSEPGRTFSRTELLHRVWEIDFDPETNLVDVLVGRLRRKLGLQAGRCIETVVREGYRIVPQVEE